MPKDSEDLTETVKAALHRWRPTPEHWALDRYLEQVAGSVIGAVRSFDAANKKRARK
jgi:hypothetical protein